MAEDRARAAADAAAANKAGRFLGSLKDALAAASREDTAKLMAAAGAQQPSGAMAPSVPDQADASPAALDAQPAAAPAAVSAAEAAREARGHSASGDVEPPTTRVMRGPAKPAPAPARTQLVRGKAPVKRGEFHQDPVVGWLVIVGGPGLGSYRPIFEGNNTIGRDASQRIPLDFGDDAISGQEQAYIRYDSGERSFLFVPNLAKTNVVSVNNKRPTAAVELSAMDVIGIGRTQVVFVPFCGPEFDWAEIADAKG